MPTIDEDLWPADLGNIKTVSPLAILRRQASTIQERTRNVLSGDVVTKTVGRRLYHTLYISAPSLDDYRYKVLSIRHESVLYPLCLSSDDANIFDQEIKSEGEFLETLKVVFSAEKIRKVIESLIVQSQSA